MSYLLAVLGVHTQARFSELLAPLGIRPQHFGALRWIAMNDGSTQQEVADLMQVRRNLMVGLVDDLEQAGLVVRGRHPVDRRAYALHLTPVGERVLAAAEGEADRVSAELLAPLDPGSRAAFQEALLAVGAALGLSPAVFLQNRDVPVRAAQPCD